MPAGPGMMNTGSIDTPIPRDVPLVVTLDFPCVDPYEVLAIYRGRRRSTRGQGPVWENMRTKGELHDRAVAAIVGWRLASGEEVSAVQAAESEEVGWRRSPPCRQLRARREEVG